MVLMNAQRGFALSATVTARSARSWWTRSATVHRTYRHYDRAKRTRANHADLVAAALTGASVTVSAPTGTGRRSHRHQHQHRRWRAPT
jgi:hypothetical protein